MKTKVLTLLLSLFCLAAMADEIKTQLVIWASDGAKTVYPLSSKPKITFSDTDLIVKSNGLESVFSLEDTNKFTYENSDDNKCTVVLNNPLATFCSPLDLDFSSVSGIKAYVASAFDPETGILTMIAVDDVPAGTGVLLVGETGTYEIPFSNVHNSYENLLVGVTIATEVAPTEEGYTNYILVNGSHGTGFYRLSASGLLSAGKAYLHLPTPVAQARKSISISYDDNITTITDIGGDEFNNAYFRLDGVRQMNPSRKGIYIKDGRKITVK